MKIKNILSVFIAVLMLISVLPLSVIAADTVAYGVWVNGVQFKYSNAESGIPCGDGKATYDVANKTVTLENAVISSVYSSAAIYSEDILVIKLAADSINTIDLSKNSEADYSFGVYSAKALAVTGSGTLNITSGKAEKDSYGIYVKTGVFSATGGTVNIKSGKAGVNSMAICVLSESGGNMNVSGKAELNCSNTASVNTRGIFVNGNMTVRDNARVISAASAASGANSYGIRVKGTFTMSGSAYVKTTGGKATDFSIGLYVSDGGDGINIKGGSLYAYSASDVKNCEAVYSKSVINVTGGKITAKSADTSVSGGLSYAMNAIEANLDGGVIKLTAGDADTAVCGLYAFSLRISGKTELTVTTGTAPQAYALGLMPDFASYIPVLRAGDAAPGVSVAKPVAVDYTSNKYIHIERKIKSDAKWYGLTVYDKNNTLNNSWVTFDMGTVDTAKAFCLQYGSTVAAEYYNGRVYGVEDNMPYRLWVSGFDGNDFVSFNTIGNGIKYEIGDMSFNYVNHKMYAIGNFNTRRALFTIDIEKGTAEKVAFIMGTKEMLLTFAIDNNGNAYGIDEKGILYSIDLAYGTTKEIGSTGLKADGVQSMAFDRDTGELFWSRYSSVDDKSAIYYVDVKDASAVKIDVAGGRTTEIAALFMAPSSYGLSVGGTPVTPLNKDDLFGNGKISFDPETLTLTLNSVKINSYWKIGNKEAYGIYSVLSGLNIVLNGENAIAISSSGAEKVYGIASKGRVSISGGKLTCVLNDAPADCAVYAAKGLTVSDAELLLYSKAEGVLVNSLGSGVSIQNSKVTISSNKKGIEALHGSVDIGNSTLVVTADKIGTETKGSVYAENDINVENSALVISSGLGYALRAGGNIYLSYSKCEAAGGKAAYNTAPEMIDYAEDTAVLTNSKPVYEGFAMWNNVTPLTKYKYVNIFPCTHNYKNVCDTSCDWCGKHRSRSHSYADKLGYNETKHYNECTKCGEKKNITEHTWTFSRVDDAGMDIYTCICGAKKVEKHYYLTGDADNSGDVTASDARIALRISVGLENISTESKMFVACDIDLDGSVDTSDARRILRAAVGLEKLPER